MWNTIHKQMKKFLLYIIALLAPALVMAQSQLLFEIDASSFAPVQTDAITGVTLDKIGLDPSRRPCARIKMHINRMTREDIAGISVRPVGGSVVVTKQIVAAEGNGLIIEMTAKAPTRFYLHHDKYGDSNEVSLDLEGDKEYRLEAQLNLLQTVVISSNVVGGEVYIDNVFKGRTDNNFSLTVNDLQHGIHKLRIEYGGIKSEQEIVVSNTNILFRLNLKQEQARPQFVVIGVEPTNASVTIDGKSYIPDGQGYVTALLNNGSYNYSVSSKSYYTETGSFIVNGAKVIKNIKLRPAHGWLSVSGSGVLQGASVYVDGELIGTAPIKSDKLASGKHSVRIVKSLYKTFEGEVTISDGKTSDYAPSLVADFATVTLTVGNDCDIYINDELKGKGSWRGDLATGAYIFEARKEGHTTTSISRTIEATPAEQKYNIPAPTPILGGLNITSSPIMADVYIDDKLVGQTPLSIDLIVGKHSVEISKDGYKSARQSVEIRNGEAQDINHALIKKEQNSSSYTIYPKSKHSHKGAGFASIIELASKISFRGASSSIIGVHYTAGYKFNDYFYLGAGAGVDFNSRAGYEDIKSATTGSYLNTTLMSVPIFIYWQANFTNRHWSPFFALAGGGNFGGKQKLLNYDFHSAHYSIFSYPNIAPFVNPQLGLGYYGKSGTGVQLSVGFQCFGAQRCLAYDSNIAILRLSPAYGIDFHLGLTF